MNESEDLKKIDEIIKKHKIEARDPDESEYAEFIDYTNQDEVNELEDYEIPDFQKLDITQFNTYVPTHFLTDEEKRIIESCRDPELKQLLLLNRNKNIQLIDLYSKVKDLLVECQENINVKQEFVNLTKQTKRVCNKIWRLGIPYFKTKDDFPCPRNEDVIRKHNNGELLFYEMTPSNKWLEKDMNRLLKGISFHYKVLKEKEFEQAIKQLETEMKKDTKKDIEKEEMAQEFKNKLEDLRNTETDMYPSLEEYNCLDWNRIAEMFLKEKYSAQDCRIFWNIYLHPSINKGPWCEAENDRLKTLVVDYNQQNWDLIAAELEFCTPDVMAIHVTLQESMNVTELIVCSAYFPGDANAEEPPPAAVRNLFEYSRRNNIQLIMGCDANSHHTVWGSTNINARGNNRTGFIACVHYFAKLNPVRIGRFTNAEDQLLFHLVEKYQQGEYIPWTKIAQHFSHRTRGQLFNRYKYFLSCRKGQTKGKFTEAEDILILVLVDRLVTDFNISERTTNKNVPFCCTVCKGFGKKFTKCAEYFPNRSVVQIKARYTSNLKAALRRGSFTVEEDNMILDHINIHGTSNWEPLVRNLDRCGGQIRQRYRTLKAYFKRHPDGDVEDAPRRRFLVLPDNEHYFLRHIADKFKNCKKIPNLQDIENLLKKNAKPNAKPVGPKTYKRSKIRQVEKLNDKSENTAVVGNKENPPKKQSKEQQNSPPKFRPKKSKHRLLLPAQEPEEVIDCDGTFTDVTLSVDDLLVDFFSKSIKMNYEESANKDHIQQATNTICLVLSSLQAQLAIPRNYKIDQRLDAIDLEILKNLTRDSCFIQRNSMNIDWLIPANLNTVVGIRTLIIRNQIYKNQRKRTHIFDKFNVDLKGKQVQWCINNHLSNQSEHSQNEIMAERNMFFQRFVALYKIPAIMTLQAPSKQVENCLTDLGEQFATRLLKTYEKRTCAVQKTDPTAFEGVFIKQQPYEEECEIVAKPCSNELPAPKLTMAERLKRRIQETLLDLTKAPPKKKFYKDTLAVMPKTTYSNSENCLEFPQTIVISDDIDTPVETQRAKRRQDLNPVDPLKETTRTCTPKQQLSIVESPKETKKIYVPKQELKFAVLPKEAKKSYTQKQELSLAVPSEGQGLNLVEPPKESKSTHIPQQDLNLEPSKEPKKTYIPKQDLDSVRPSQTSKRTYVRKRKPYVPKRKPKATSTEPKETTPPLVKSESAGPVKTENCTNLYPGESGAQSSFNLGKGELILVNDSPPDNRRAGGSSVDQDLLDLDALNKVLKKEKHFVEESFDF